MLSDKKFNLFMGFMLVALIGLAFALSQTLVLNLNSTFHDDSQLGYCSPVLPSSGGGGPSFALTRRSDGSKLAFGSHGGGPRLAFGARGDRPNKAVSLSFAEQSSKMLIQGGGGGPRLAVFNSGGGGSSRGVVPGMGSGGPRRNSADGYHMTPSC